LQDKQNAWFFHSSTDTLNRFALDGWRPGQLLGAVLGTVFLRNKFAAFRSLSCLVFLAVLLTGCVDTSQKRPVANSGTPASASDKYGQVYLFRGLGGVFSVGMDDLARKLRRQGIAATVLPHGGWRRATNRIETAWKNGDRRPVVFVGHSFGGNALIAASDRLNKDGIPIAYAATIDPTRHRPIPSNVRLLKNFYYESGFWGTPLEASNGGRARVVNVDLSQYEAARKVSHAAYDNLEFVQDIIVKDIRRVVRH
jgi:hypothetical protein